MLCDWLFHLGYFKNPAHNNSVLVSVNSIVHFDVSMEIYLGEFSPGNVGHTAVEQFTAVKEPFYYGK